jgi:hypothetical protein
VVNSEGMEPSSLMQMINGDPCSTPDFYLSLNIDISALCANATFLQLTLANVLNYMSAVLQTTNASAPTNWPSISTLPPIQLS